MVSCPLDPAPVGATRKGGVCPELVEGVKVFRNCWRFFTSSPLMPNFRLRVKVYAWTDTGRVLVETEGELPVMVKRTRAELEVERPSKMT